MTEELILPKEVVEEAFALLGEMPSKVSRLTMNKIEQTARIHSDLEFNTDTQDGGET